MRETKSNIIREKQREHQKNSPPLIKAKSVNDYYKQMTNTMPNTMPKAKDENGNTAKKQTKKQDSKRPNKPSGQKNSPKRENYNNSKESVKVIPLGGLNEIGKNLTVFEYKNQIIVIDCGMSFPEDEMFGIDIVIPDFTYLEENKEKILGIFITHGHEDHIGAIPYLLKRMNVPIYATRFPIALIENKLKEHNIKAKLNIIESGDIIKLGDFKVEGIRTTHSIPDALSFAIESPAGIFYHTGDFKIDFTPIDGEPINFAKLSEIAKKGVTMMFADSTNATRPGFTSSERLVGNTLDGLLNNINGRVIIATFSSNVHRVQRIIELAVTHGRKVAISGRSMENVVAIAREYEYLKIPAGTIIDIKDINKYADKELIIITTGSQGEPMSALSRMSINEHKNVKLKKGDTVIFSSSPVPGNEKTVSNVVNKLFEKEVKVIYSDIADIHVSGHACQEELKIIHSIIKPKFFVPVHGEKRHLIAHAELAESLGMKEKNICVIDNGDKLTVTQNSVKIQKEAVNIDPVLVDGLGIGDVGNIVLKERKSLSESGIITVAAAVDRQNGVIISGPEIVTRGFIYVKENEDIVIEAKVVAQKSLEKVLKGNTKDWNTIKNTVRDDMKRFIYRKTKRNPMILPTFLDI